jgi:hypothetical protein
MIKKLIYFLLTVLFTISGISYGQIANSADTSRKHTILLDISHKPRFWDDPARMNSKVKNRLDRVRYMTDQIKNNAESVNADLNYIKDEIKPGDLKNCNLLFIHIPSAKYKTGEIKVITDYLKNGGSLFLAMDVDYWSTLEQTNVNEIIEPFGIQFGGQSPDTLSGGYTKEGIITSKPLKITYAEGRIVKGGTPFCFNTQTEEYPFGVCKELQGGGRLIVMGDGMVSLYMTGWKGVNDYQCSEFMYDVFKWLLK